MSVEVPQRAAAGAAMARWSAKALLITMGAFLVGGAIWYPRAATVPLIVAALVSTQLLPFIDWATAGGIPRGLAIAASLIGVVGGSCPPAQNAARPTTGGTAACAGRTRPRSTHSSNAARGIRNREHNRIASSSPRCTAR
jgi:hypothetical protein